MVILYIQKHGITYLRTSDSFTEVLHKFWISIHTLELLSTSVYLKYRMTSIY